MMKNLIFINKELSLYCVFLESMNILFSLISCFFSKISVLWLNCLKDCVAAAVGKELSEYVAFLLNVRVPL